jgi:hypothetical protein
MAVDSLDKAVGSLADATAIDPVITEAQAIKQGLMSLVGLYGLLKNKLDIGRLSAFEVDTIDINPAGKLKYRMTVVELIEAAKKILPELATLSQQPGPDMQCALNELGKLSEHLCKAEEFLQACRNKGIKYDAAPAQRGMVGHGRAAAGGHGGAAVAPADSASVITTEDMTVAFNAYDDAYAKRGRTMNLMRLFFHGGYATHVDDLHKFISEISGKPDTTLYDADINQLAEIFLDRLLSNSESSSRGVDEAGYAQSLFKAIARLDTDDSLKNQIARLCHSQNINRDLARRGGDENSTVNKRYAELFGETLNVTIGLLPAHGAGNVAVRPEVQVHQKGGTPPSEAHLP